MNRNVLPPLPSLEDLFNSTLPCPFSLMTTSAPTAQSAPAKTEPQQRVDAADPINTLPGGANRGDVGNKFELISDDDEPSSKRLKASDAYETRQNNVKNEQNEQPMSNSVAFSINSGTFFDGDPCQRAADITIDVGDHSFNRSKQLVRRPSHEDKKENLPSKRTSGKANIESQHQSHAPRSSTTFTGESEAAAAANASSTKVECDSGRQPLFEYFSHFIPDPAPIESKETVTAREFRDSDADVLDLLDSALVAVSHSAVGEFDVTPPVDFLIGSDNSDNCLGSYGYDHLDNVSGSAGQLAALNVDCGNFLDPDEFLSNTSMPAVVEADLNCTGSASWMGGGGGDGSADSSGEFILPVECLTTPVVAQSTLSSSIANISCTTSAQCAKTYPVCENNDIAKIGNKVSDTGGITEKTGAVKQKNREVSEVEVDDSAKPVSGIGAEEKVDDGMDIGVEDHIDDGGGDNDIDDNDAEQLPDVTSNGVYEDACTDANEHQYEILDDLEEDVDEDDEDAEDEGGDDDDIYSISDDSDGVEVPVEEVEAMLEEGISNSKEPSEELKRVGGGGAAARRRLKNAIIADDGGDRDFQGPNVLEKIVLVDKGQDPFDILPLGWLIITHRSGMPLYLHKPTRVCCLSRPYFLGSGSARKHNIPVSAIPCLQYRRAQERAKMAENATTPATSVLCDTMAAGTTVSSTTTETANSAVENSTAAVNKDGATAEVAIAVSTTEAVNVENSLSNDQDPSNVQSAQSCPVMSSQGPVPPHPISSIPVKVQSVEEHKLSNTLDAVQFREYCKGLFEFKTITVRRFRRWKDRRRHNVHLKKAAQPTLPPSTKLITCPAPTTKGTPNMRKKAFVLNPAGKSMVCILHEYAQHAIRLQPRYIFRELENSQTPYSATVIFGDVQYGTGYAMSKKAAKIEAARAALSVLIPEMAKVTKADEKVNMKDLSFFDEIKIEDPRVSELCIKAGQPTPYQILTDCLKRNYGMGDTEIKMKMRTVRHQRSEYTMTVGKHEASVICKNKRDGKQQASQAILQLMHPHVTTWGSLLRLYAQSTDIKDKKEEEHSVTELQTRAEPNKAILSKLKLEMTKLYQKRDALKSTLKGKINFHETPKLMSSELGSVDL